MSTPSSGAPPLGREPFEARWAWEQRTPPQGTVIHSDQGTQFTSWAFTDRALASGLVPSMGSVGDCFDCDDSWAVSESFWSRMQVELLDRKRWNTRTELANAIFEYIDGSAQRAPTKRENAPPRSSARQASGVPGQQETVADDEGQGDADRIALGLLIDPNDGFFDASATYIGAFQPGGEDWTQGWTSFPTN